MSKLKKILWNIAYQIYLFDFVKGKFAWWISDNILWPREYETDCGYACGHVEPYGFVPECGCPVHDKEDIEEGCWVNEEEMTEREFKKVCYIAGPYSSTSNGKTINENIEAAQKIAVELWEQGIVAICPHMNTAGFEELTTLENKEYVDGDLLIVERVDFLVLTPDWHLSKGAIREVAHAIEKNIPFYVYPNYPDQFDVCTVTKNA